MLTVIPTLSSLSLPDRSSRKAASRAKVLVSPKRPDLEARSWPDRYCQFHDDRADIDDPTAARSTMCPSTACDRKKAPERLTSKTLCQSSSVNLRMVLSIVMPALLIRMSSRPCCSRTSFTHSAAVIGRGDVAAVGADRCRKSGREFLRKLIRTLHVSAEARRNRRAVRGELLRWRRRFPEYHRDQRHSTGELYPRRSSTGSSATLTVADSLMGASSGSSQRLWWVHLILAHARLRHNLGRAISDARSFCVEKRTERTHRGTLVE